MSARVHARHNQGAHSNKSHNPYEILQDAIYAATKIKCSVLVTPQHVSIRAASYQDFVLAKSAIRGRVVVDIIQG